MSGRNPVELAVRLAEAGAPVLSVVTEAEHYGGSRNYCGKLPWRQVFPFYGRIL